VLEETAVVDKRNVLKGKVRVTTKVEVADEMVRAALQADAVDVVRVPIGEMVDHPPEARTEGETTIIPVVEEVLVVEKRLFLKEEIHIRRSAETDTVEIPVTLRRQRVVVQRFDEAGRPTGKKEA
jgi:stress response protein YsnF